MNWNEGLPLSFSFSKGFGNFCANLILLCVFWRDWHEFYVLLNRHLEPCNWYIYTLFASCLSDFISNLSPLKHLPISQLEPSHTKLPFLHLKMYRAFFSGRKWFFILLNLGAFALTLLILYVLTTVSLIPTLRSSLVCVSIVSPQCFLSPLSFRSSLSISVASPPLRSLFSLFLCSQLLFSLLTLPLYIVRHYSNCSCPTFIFIVVFIESFLHSSSSKPQGQFLVIRHYILSFLNVFSKCRFSW